MRALAVRARSRGSGRAARAPSPETAGAAQLAHLVEFQPLYRRLACCSTCGGQVEGVCSSSPRPNSLGRGDPTRSLWLPLLHSIAHARGLHGTQLLYRTLGSLACPLRCSSLAPLRARHLARRARRRAISPRPTTRRFSRLSAPSKLPLLLATYRCFGWATLCSGCTHDPASDDAGHGLSSYLTLPSIRPAPCCSSHASYSS